MFRRFALSSNVALLLRFERGPGPDTVHYKPIPKSMQPKQLEDDFTPFPLPKFDEDMGYGPVRLRNIPDVELAKERREKAKLAVAEVDLYESLLDGGQADGRDERCDGKVVVVVDTDHQDDTTAPVLGSGLSSQTVSAADGSDMARGYVVSKDYPLVDRLHCTRSIEELLAQFEDRPQVESRAAALADLASTMSSRSNEELLEMFAVIGAPFSPEGRGLNFLTVRASKFGRPYYVPNCLLAAYVNLVDATTVTLVHEQPWRLVSSPTLFIGVLHFMALIKVFEPNKWFTFSDHAPSNAADYKHPTGTNRFTAFWGTGEELFDFMVGQLRVGEDNAIPPVLEQCTREQMVDILSGFCAVMPDGKALGTVFNTVTQAFHQRIREVSLGALNSQDLAVIERMYFVTALCDAADGDLLQLLLSDTSSPRGPDFFAAVSRIKDSTIKERALCLLRVAIVSASTKGDTDGLLAILEGGSELLLAIVDKGVAHEFAIENLFDYRILNSFRHFSVVAERLRTERPLGDPRIPSSLRDVQAQLVASNEAKASSSLESPPFVHSVPRGSATIKMKRPIMTMLSQLEYLNSVDSVFILHSSLMATTTDQLVSAVRRLPSGKDSLIITMSCLRALSVKSRTSPNIKEREACGCALEIISYELERGRAVLLPFSEEILLHDAGAYCDEDLMLWTVAAFFARELPLVKVHTLMHKRCTARTPYRFLKGGHSLLVSSRSLYDKDAPLLSSLHSKELRLVTRSTSLMTPVRDRKCTLQYYNPVRARFVYRRDKALFDKYHVTTRNLAAGFSRGALKHDWRSVGVYTPDHPQVPYRPLQPSLLGEATAIMK